MSTNKTYDVVAIGNHNGGYKQEMQYFQMPAEQYSTVIDQARFIVLNSDNDSSGPAQAQWLDREPAMKLLFLRASGLSHKLGYLDALFQEKVGKTVQALEGPVPDVCLRPIRPGNRPSAARGRRLTPEQEVTA